MNEDEALNAWAAGGPLGGYAQPVDRLARLRTLERAIADHIAVEVRLARTQGAAWSEVAAALGMSKQGAQQRYGTSTGVR